jgi:DNA-directed RNA polymerase subunit M/transcription elongation factor TFIIS
MITPEDRQRVVKAISIVLSSKTKSPDKNADVIEKSIFSLSESVLKYNSLSLETLRLLRDCKMKDVVTTIKNGNGLDSDAFNHCKTALLEQDTFLSQPLDVQEGVLNCSKCGSNKTFSYSKQIRRSDEGMTTFVLCSVCNHKFRIN